jgi:glycosyltransferase involved in cell wall biosynthesis
MKNFPSLRLVKTQTYSISPSISLGIRVKNEIAAIGHFWESVKKQTYFNNLEIVFLDSGSTDGTTEFLNQLNCNLYTIDSNEFSYGETCNLIMNLSRCEYVCFFSGHVILESDSLLERLSNFLKTEPNVSGYFRQIPNYKVGVTIYDRTFLKYKYPVHSGDRPLLVSSEKNGFSNAASLICRRHWECVKFKNVIASEDYFWAKDVLAKHLKIYYFDKLNIEHSHKETLDSIYKRVRINAKSRYPQGVSAKQTSVIFVKVFFAIFLNSRNLRDSLKYASIHASAYKNLTRDDNG